MKKLSDLSPEERAALIGELKPGTSRGLLAALTGNSQTARGFANAILPLGQFGPDFNYSIGGPDVPVDLESADYKAGAGAGTAMTLGSSGGLRKVTQKAAGNVIKGAVENLFRNKAFQSMPEAMKTDPKLLEEASRKFANVNRFRKKGTGRYLDAPTEIAQKADDGLRGAVDNATAGARRLAALTGSAFDNLLPAQAVGAGIENLAAPFQGAYQDELARVAQLVEAGQTPAQPAQSTAPNAMPAVQQTPTQPAGANRGLSFPRT